jgi:hypothetical protein
MNTATTTYEDFIKTPNRAHTYSNFNGKYVENSNSGLNAVDSAGSLAVSIKEMANWLNFQIANGKFQGKQLVSIKSILETRKPQIAMDKGSYYGLGWTINTQRHVFNHAGDALPSKTIVEISPSQKYGIVIVSNEGNYGLGFSTALVSAFYQLYNNGKITDDKWPSSKKTADSTVAQYFAAKKTKPSPPISPAMNIKTYTGTYLSKLYGKIRITNNGKTQLKIYQGNNIQPINLEHWNGNTFRVIYPVITSSIYNTVDFETIKQGKAQQVTMNIYNIIKTNGTFIRAKKPV